MAKTGREQRGELYSELREQGWEPERPYREYSLEQLQGIKAERDAHPPIVVEGASFGELGNVLLADFQADGFEEGVKEDDHKPRATSPQAQQPHDRRPVGQLKSKGDPAKEEESTPEGLPEGALRADEHGRIWFREEIGPEIAKNRRLRKRITQVVPESVEVRQIQSGDYIETIEVVGERTRNLDAFITLPPTQVGIYLDPRFPWKVFTYNGALGFSFGDINDYYGGVEFVPKTVKRKFVGNMLAYDIKSAIAEVERKFREMQLSRSMPMMGRR